MKTEGRETGRTERLSARLAAVAALVTPGGTAADIGCDHGLLAVELVQSGRAERVIACDLRPGPLSAAQKNIARSGLENRIETRLADGLQGIAPGEVQSIVIAGMGGTLMCRILTEGEAAARAAGELILAPQSEVSAFRRFLHQNRYAFLDEDMVEEDGKFYPIMRVRPAAEGELVPELTGADFAFGPLLRRTAHPVLLRWLEQQEKAQQRIRAQLTAEIRGREACAESASDGDRTAEQTVDHVALCRLKQRLDESEEESARIARACIVGTEPDAQKTDSPAMPEDAQGSA